jgi:hypothetical protein
MLIARVVLQVGVRHERHDAVKDRRGRERTPSEIVERHPGLERQNREAEHEQHGVEDQQCRRVLLPGLRTAIEGPLDGLQRTARAVAAVHDPGEVAAEGDRQQRRRHQHRDRK